MPAPSKATLARRAALSLVSERRRRSARARELLRRSEALSVLDERERALAVRLVMGVTAAEGELDRVINTHLAHGMRLEPRVRDALRIAAFELLYLGTPRSAAVSQGVELVRGVAPRAAGLANAVLRRVSTEDVAALDEARRHVTSGAFGADDLARVGALPPWLCEWMVASVGPAEAAALAASALGPAGSFVAANRVRHTAGEAGALLVKAGCEPTAGPLPGSFQLGAPSRLASSGLVEQVDVLPCDLAAQEVVRAAAPAPGSRVLEVGQGRGTKTILLEGEAVAAGGPCEIVAVEVDSKKSELARHRMARAGVAEHVTCVAADARMPADSEAVLPKDLLGTFDLVFVDAPCSGTGTLARHPEIAWSLAPEAPAELAALQGQILAASASRVSQGGALLYATCSVLSQENEDVVRAFMASPTGAGFELVEARRTAQLNADTHFYARLRRRG